jgi:tetratricopeptide (TPR) repeat protein
VLTGYAYFMMDKEEFQKAETYFRKAIHIEANPGAYYGLGLLLVKAGKLEDARQSLEDFFSRTENNKGIKTFPVYHQVKEFYKDLSVTMGLSKRSH